MLFETTAAVLAESERPVLAGYDKGQLRAVTLALLSCPACNTQVVSNYSLHAGCVTCGETMEPAESTIQRDSEGNPVVDSDGDIVSATLDVSKETLVTMPVIASCSECETIFRGDSVLASALAGEKLYCPVCSNVLEALAETTEEAPAEEAPDESTEETSAEEAPAEEASVEQPAAPVPAPVDATPINDNAGNEPASAMSDEAVKAAGSTSTEASTTPVVEAPKVEAPKAEEPKVEPKVEEPKAELPKPEAKVEVQAMLQVDALSMVLASSADVAYHLVMSSATTPVWFLFADHTPVGFSDKNKVTANLKKIYEQPAFGKNFAVSAATGLTAQVIKDFGITPSVVEFKTDKVTAQAVTAAVEMKTKELDTKISQVKASFEQAVGIAAVGVNKGLFADSRNTLRDAFVTTLSSINVNHPERLVDSIFQQHGQDFLKVVIAKAMELQTKSPEALNEVAQLVQSAPATGHQSSPSAQVTAELARGSVPVIASAIDFPSNPVKISDARRAVQGLGRMHTRRF